MSETKHTPGPWHANTPAEDKHAAGSSIRDQDGEIVAVSAMPSIANARLIAAAPDLLEALRRTLDVAIGHACEALRINADECETWSWVKKARLAIAKAEGR